MTAVKLRGLARVMKNLNRELGKIEDRSGAGIEALALAIKGTAVENAPRDTGNLKNSAVVDSEKTSRGPVSGVGFQADYSVHVHENVEANFKEGGPKFLERAIDYHHSEAVPLVRKYAKVKR